MTTLFDKLGIDKTAGITDDEIKAIQNMLEKIKVRAAQVAEVNDAEETKKILGAYYTFLGLFVGKSSTEIEAAFGLIQNALSGSTAPRALAAGSPTTGDPDDLQDELDAANASNSVLKANQSILLAALGKVFGAAVGLTDDKVSRSLPTDTETKLDEIKHSAATGAGVVRKDAVKTKADIVKAKILATKTALNDKLAKDAAIAAIDAVISQVS